MIFFQVQSLCEEVFYDYNNYMVPLENKNHKNNILKHTDE